MPRIREAMRSGWKYSSWSSFSPTEASLTGPAGDRPHGQRGAAAGVAVELREDDAVEGDPLLERERDVHGLLAGHRVENEEHVRRLRLVTDALELVHQLLVDVQPPGGVEDRRRRARPCAPRRARAALPRPGRFGPARRPGSGSAGRAARAARSPPVAGGRRRRAPGRLPSLRRSSASLAAAVVLPEPWRPASRITVGGRPNASRESPEPISAVSSSWTIFTTCWPGSQALQDVLAERTLLEGGREVLGDLEVDVRLEQREADLAHRLRDRLLVEPAASAEAAERRLKLVGKRVEHGRHSVERRRGPSRSLARTLGRVGSDDRAGIAERNRHAALRRHRRIDASPPASSGTASRRRAPACGSSCARQPRLTTATRSTGPETACSSRSRAARDAVAAAAEIQRALAREPWPAEEAHRLRIGIHTGEPELGDEGYVGMDVVVAARICAAAHGEQIIVSQSDPRRLLAPSRSPAPASARSAAPPQGRPEPAQLFQLARP